MTKPKHKRIAPAPIASATLRILKKKPEGAGQWSERVVETLLAIATNPKTPAVTAMQAIRIVIEQSSRVSSGRDGDSASFVDDGVPSVAEIRQRSQAEVEKRIAELLGSMGPIPGVQADPAQ
jgi:hypothetical protein